MHSFAEIAKKIVSGGVQFISKEEAEKRKASIRAEERKERSIYRLMDSGFSALKNKEIKFNLQQQLCLEKMLKPLRERLDPVLGREFVPKHDKAVALLSVGLPYLYGKNGCGKTAIAQRVAIFVGSEYDSDFLFVKATDMIGDCQENPNKYKNVPFLFIDDLFVHRVTPIVFDSLFNIIDYRYENSLPMMITSNVEAKGIVHKIMEVSNNHIAESMIRALIDRVFGACYPMQLGGKSMRMIKTMERIKKEIEGYE